MKCKINNNIEKINIFLSFLSIGTFILFGNSLTFNFGERIPIKISEIIICISLFILIIINKREFWKFAKLSKITKFVFCFLFIGTFSLIFNGILNHYELKKIIYGLFYSVRILFFCFSASVFINICTNYNIESKKIIDFVLNCFLVVIVIGLFQFVFFPDALKWYKLFQRIGVHWQNADPHIKRFLSTYFDPNYLAACLIIPATFTLHNWLKRGIKIDLIKFIVFSVAIVLTVSRSGLLGLVISSGIVLGMYFFKQKDEKIKKRIIFIVLFVFIAAVLMLLSNERLINRILNSMNDKSTFLRFESWNRAFNIIKENFILGIGYNALGFFKSHNIINSATSFGIDSSLLFIFVTTGIVGFVYFIFKFIKFLLIIIYSKNENSYPIFAILISSIVICNFNNLLFYILWLFPILIIVNLFEKENITKLRIIDARMLKMSGIGTYIQNLIKNGCYDYALGNRNELSEYFDEDKIIDYDSKIYGIKEQIKFPYLKICKLNPDVLHVPHYNVPIFYSGRMIVTIHDLTHIVMPKFLPSKFAYIYARFMIGIACLKAEKILTVSENTKKDIIKYYHVNPKKISVVYNGVGEEFTKKDKKEISYLYNKYSIPTNKKIVMYVGNLKKHKNLENLLEAFSKLKNIENYRLILVGKAFKNIDELNEKEKLLNIDNYVVHTGVVNQEELVDFYNLADLFIFPSLYEGFGLPILESLKCGTPVICSNTSSMPEVGGKVVSYFNPYDIEEIKKSIENHCDEKEKFDKQKVEKWLKNFDWQNSSDQIKNIL